ncbi:MAG: hypothetical protein AAFN78_17200 [Pseudomonadota bacterium]
MHPNWHRRPAASGPEREPPAIRREAPQPVAARVRPRYNHDRVTLSPEAHRALAKARQDATAQTTSNSAPPPLPPSPTGLSLSEAHAAIAEYLEIARRQPD